MTSNVTAAGGPAPDDAEAVIRPGPAVPAWVGAVELPDPPGSCPAGLPERLDPRFRGARLLVTRGGTPLATVDVGVVDGRPDAAALTAGLAALALRAPGAERAPAGPPDPPVLPATVVAVCTRDRPGHVATLLEHLRALPEAAVTLLVVDNGPSDDRTRDVVAAARERDPRLRYVRDPVGGTSRARNRALAEADALGAEVVAFVDDDVTMRPGWLAAVRAAFTGTGPDPAARVSCVTGPVLAGTLETEAQLASDGALGWTNGFARRRFALDAPSASPLFPFAPGEFGVGANFAVRTADARAVGGFDELLGGGAPCRGGEDIEFWVRLVTSGRTLVYEPATWLWHHHRDSDDALRAQLAGYAVGLGGYLAAVVCDPAMRRLAVRRLPAVLSHLTHLRRREAAVGVHRDDGGLAPAAVLRGASAYLRHRSRGIRRSRRTGS